MNKDSQFPVIDYRATAERICRLCREKQVRAADIINYRKIIDCRYHFAGNGKTLKREYLNTESLLVISQLTRTPINELLVLKCPE